MLESTLYLRNQLLRDSDWASMAHSLELRTPLVDAQLLATLGPYAASFKGGIGKAMLAHAPGKPLLEAVVNRPKTGFNVPMATWLSKSTDHRSWSDLALLAPAGTPWARRWGRIVVERTLACG
jgi:asparagine synthase (glutamine-hydrolysing)